MDAKGLEWHSRLVDSGVLTFECAIVCVRVARFTFVVTWGRGKSKVVRVAAHRIPLFEHVGCSLQYRLLGQAVGVARVPRYHFLEPLKAVVDRRLCEGLIETGIILFLNFVARKDG
jgi:hypothetical protein